MSMPVEHATLSDVVATATLEAAEAPIIVALRAGRL
jgi:hypothetical protein